MTARELQTRPRHARPLTRRFAVGALVAATLLAVQPTVAQEYREPEGTPLPPDAKVFPLPPGYESVHFLPTTDNGLPNVMVTGYWPPTNDMLRRFSPNPAQNPDPWVGENWEGRGYNVYAFFPEFPNGLGRGEGDFEVDYQDTSGDFWAISDVLRPVAVVTTGRTGVSYDWRLEGGARNYAASSWSSDYLDPRRPTPELPISSELTPYDRMSTLPIQQIIDAVVQSGSSAHPFTTTIDTSRFLCDFNGYHANWYQALHASPGDPDRCWAAGHIHVGSAMTLTDAELAAEATIRALIEHLDAVRIVFRDGFEADGLAAWSSSAS